MKIHELKTDPGPFQAIKDGIKNFELRLNDRDFRAGDHLMLREYNLGEYTGEHLWAEVTYVLTGYGLQSGYCVMALDVGLTGAAERIKRTAQAEIERLQLEEFWQSPSGAFLRVYLDSRNIDWQMQSWKTIQRNLSIVVDAVHNFDAPERSRGEIRETVKWDI